MDGRLKDCGVWGLARVLVRALGDLGIEYLLSAMILGFRYWSRRKNRERP